MTLAQKNVAWASALVREYMLAGREDRAYRLAVELSHYAVRS